MANDTIHVSNPVARERTDLRLEGSEMLIVHSPI